MAGYNLLNFLLLSCLVGRHGNALLAVIPSRSALRQAPSGPYWHGGFSPYGGYPGGGGHGTYPAGFGSDQYHGWQYPQNQPVQGPNASIDVSLVAASSISPPIDPDFIGFAFEEASFPRYVLNRDGSVNQFSLNLINAIVSRTGGKPIIRLGGTSPDYGRYIPSQQAAALPPAEVYNFQDVGGTSIGPKFWDLTHIIPNSVYIVQLPLATTNISETVLWAKTAAAHIGLGQIQAFEVGNEPDLYPTNSTDPAMSPLGPPYYQGELTNETYTGNFTKYVNAIKAAVDIPDEPLFQAFDTSSHLGDDVLANGYILDVETNFDLGINAGNDIKQVASHYYQTNGGEYANLSAGLMNHYAIADRLDLYRKFIAYLAPKGIPFILDEVGNSLNPEHTYEYQAVLGSALWAIDFQLYAMTIGVARVNWQQIMHSGFDLWLPVDSSNGTESVSRQVFSSFYAMPFVADFIGDTGGATRAVEVQTGQNDTVAYAAFVNGSLARIAIVNLNIWDANGTAAQRPATTFAIILPSGYEQVEVDILISPEGAHASADTITYGGSQWTSASNGLEVRNVANDTKVLNVRNGEVQVTVYSSQAVLLHLL